jgi:23S rRNA (uracil1939-C5)-methyltransferase
MNERIRLHLDDMAYGGAAIGRHEGKAVFVPGGIAGEDVLVEIVEERPRYARGRLVEVVAASPDRVAPPCEHFGECGGCQWQHIAYEAQLRFKREIVRGQLERFARLGEAPVRPVIGMEDPWAYRNHMQFAVDNQGHLCLMAMGSERPVRIGNCRLLCPELTEVFQDLELDYPGLERVGLRAGQRTGERMLILETGDGEAPELEVDRPLSCIQLLPDGTGVALVGSTHVHEEVGGRRLKVSAGSFFQVNSEQAQVLVRLVQEYAAVQPGDTVLDAYGGVGTLGLSLAEHAGLVIILEGNPTAAVDARDNASEATNVSVIEGAVEDVLPTLSQEVDVAVLDPPRAGVAPRALEALADKQPRRIVYVSCDPGPLARNVRTLLDRGYRLEVVQPVDMFPQTHHVETVCLMSKSR